MVERGLGPGPCDSSAQRLCPRRIRRAVARNGMTRESMQQRMHKLGFTLMELLLVMLIIAVSAAIVAPSFTGFSRGRRLPNTATALMTTGRWCRVQALSEGTTFRLNIDRSGRQWSVTKDDGTGLFKDVTEETGKAHPLPEGIDFGEMVFESTVEANPDGDYVTFKPSGRTDVVTISLVSQEGHAISVACDMPLGTFHIVKTGETP